MKDKKTGQYQIVLHSALGLVFDPLVDVLPLLSCRLSTLPRASSNSGWQQGALGTKYPKKMRGRGKVNFMYSGVKIVHPAREELVFSGNHQVEMSRKGFSTTSIHKEWRKTLDGNTLHISMRERES